MQFITYVEQQLHLEISFPDDSRIQDILTQFYELCEPTSLYIRSDNPLLYRFCKYTNVPRIFKHLIYKFREAILCSLIEE